MPRILLVEDSKTQALQMTAKLVDEGYEVELAYNGQEALDILPEFWPHLILTDMEMPIMDGLELVKRARKQFPTVPIILITAKGSDTTAIEALDHGASAYLPKSMLDDRLFSTIDEVFDVMEADSTYSKLVNALEYNEFRFVLENDVRCIRPLVDLIKQMAAGVLDCDETDCVRIGMAIDHAMRNAIFHGNLELTKQQLEDDAELVVEGTPTLVERRAAEPGFADRRVGVEIQLTPQEAKVVVRDEGVGFDFLKVPVPDDPSVLDPEKGRGLVLIQSLMDEVHFNASGNEITMIKHAKVRGNGESQS